jgi:ABC-type antimicrobial peptide transport system permease subunit
MSAVGLYSVVSYSVIQRTSEFGIRMALGAPKSHVFGIVFQSIVASVGSGLLAGALLTLVLGRVLVHWAADQHFSLGSPLLLLAAAATLALIATVACLIPARRAAAVQPITAIRYE